MRVDRQSLAVRSAAVEKIYILLVLGDKEEAGRSMQVRKYGKRESKECNWVNFKLRKSVTK